MNDDQLLRYSRHILLDEVGIEGQQRLIDSHVLVVGAGGLGSPVAMYSGGQRRRPHHDWPTTMWLTSPTCNAKSPTPPRVWATPRSHSAAQAMLALNPEVRVTALPHKLDATQLDTLVPNVQRWWWTAATTFKTRQAVNAACVKHKVPLVSGAAIRMDGQLAVYDARDDTSPCYACMFPRQTTAPEEVEVRHHGRASPRLVGVIGTLASHGNRQAAFTGMGSRLTGRLQMLDGRDMAWNEVCAWQRNATLLGVWARPKPFPEPPRLR